REIWALGVVDRGDAVLHHRCGRSDKVGGDLAQERSSHIGSDRLSMRLTWTSMVIGVLCLSAISYLAACISVKTRLQSSYDSIQIADPAYAVIARLGSPSVKEISDKPFYRYASSECRKP